MKVLVKLDFWIVNSYQVVHIKFSFFRFLKYILSVFLLLHIYTLLLKSWIKFNTFDQNQSSTSYVSMWLSQKY